MDLKDGFVLGDWLVHPMQGTFEQDGSIARVQPKSMDVLLVLAALIEVGFERWLEKADRDAATEPEHAEAWNDLASAYIRQSDQGLIPVDDASTGG